MKKNLLTLLLLISSFTMMWAANINYKFTNSTVTYSGTGEDRVTYYEFDIVAWVDHTEGLYLQMGQIYFDYNTGTFGEYIDSHSNVEVQLLGPLAVGGLPLFTLILNDNTNSTLSIVYETSDSRTKSELETYYEKLPNNSASAVEILHVKMKVLPDLGSTNVVLSDKDPTFDDGNLHSYYLIIDNSATIQTFDAMVYSSTIENDVISLDGNGDPALPVTLESFIANYHQGAVELEWSTASETQNAGFILKRALVNEGETLEYEVITSYLDNDDLTGAGTTTERHVYTYSDRAVRPGAAYSYILEDVDYSGNIVQHDPVRVVIPENVLAATEDFRLQPAYPNPFNPSFTVPFELHRAMDVRIAMYDLSGRQVRSIVSSRMDAGSYDLRVDASDLRSGIYFVRSIIGDQVNTQKMLLVK